MAQIQEMQNPSHLKKSLPNQEEHLRKKSMKLLKAVVNEVIVEIEVIVVIEVIEEIAIDQKIERCVARHPQGPLIFLCS